MAIDKGLEEKYISVSALSELLAKFYQDGSAVVQDLLAAIELKSKSAPDLFDELFFLSPELVVDEVIREMAKLGLLTKKYSKASDLTPGDLDNLIRAIKPPEIVA